MGAILAVVILFLFLKNFSSNSDHWCGHSNEYHRHVCPHVYVRCIPQSHVLGWIGIGNWNACRQRSGCTREHSSSLRQRILSKRSRFQRNSRSGNGHCVLDTHYHLCIFTHRFYRESPAIFGDLSLAAVSSLLASLGVAIFFVPMLAASEFSIEGTQNMTSFKRRWTAIESFKTDWQALGGVKRLFWLLWGIPRLLLHLSLNLLSVLFVYPVLATLWVWFTLSKWIIPPIQGTLLWFAERFGVYTTK